MSPDGDGPRPRRRIGPFDEKALVVLLALGSARTTWPGFLPVLLGAAVYRARRRRAA